MTTTTTTLGRLSPRADQTLERLLKGDSEKEVAGHLGISPNTVHTYVKSVYRAYGVRSRAELLSLFYRAAVVAAGTGPTEVTGEDRRPAQVG